MLSVQKGNITVYNKDIISLINNYIPRFGTNTFIYFDPPYYNKGQKLYKNFLTPCDHQKIHDAIVQNVHVPWIITYDGVPEICNLYAPYMTREFDLIYSAANKGKASELMIFSDDFLCPTQEQLLDHQISISFRV